MTSLLRSLKAPLLFLIAVTLVASMVASPVLARATVSARFVGTPTITKNSNFSLTANFKVSGSGNTPIQIVLVSLGGTASLQCLNPANNNPSTKQVTFGPLLGTAFLQPNGQVTASVTMGPPPLPSASQICSNHNSSIKILSLTYHNVVLRINSTSPDTFNFGNVDP
jgi:hypothetical protein